MISTNLWHMFRRISRLTCFLNAFHQLKEKPWFVIRCQTCRRDRTALICEQVIRRSQFDLVIELRKNNDRHQWRVGHCLCASQVFVLCSCVTSSMLRRKMIMSKKVSTDHLPMMMFKSLTLNVEQRRRERETRASWCYLYARRLIFFD